MGRLRLGVLISGSGTNLQAIIDAIGAGVLDAEVALVVSSRPGVRGIERAQAAGIDVLVMTPEDYAADALAADREIASALLAAGVEYVVMAGYMRMVRRPLLEAFPDRILNLHPALLPSFPGAHAIRDAYEAGVKVTGVTVHFANEVYDEGPIIAQEPVRVLEDDTCESLEERIHEVEHRLYPEVLRLLAAGCVTIDPQTRRVRQR